MLTHHIEIVGARENNLKDVSVQIPKRQITVFTGVSGSGKSSLVFDTIAAEAQRQLNETFTAFVRNFLPSYGQPDVDTIENLSAAIIVDQKRLGGGSRSTVGTITDIYSLLRLLFSRVGKPHVGYSNAFSFNDPQGMCPECEGLGKVTTLDLDKFLDRSKSLNEGAILHPDFAVGRLVLEDATPLSGFFDLDKPLADYTDEEWQHAAARRRQGPAGVAGRHDQRHVRGRGRQVHPALHQEGRRRDVRAQPRGLPPVRHAQAPARSARAPGSTRRRSAAEIDGYNIAELAAMEATELRRRCCAAVTDAGRRAGRREPARPGAATWSTIGLGYLSLDRETATLSGGESQRIKMVRHLSSSLTDMMYIFDEPSVGLHARDVAAAQRAAASSCATRATRCWSSSTTAT